MTKKNAKRMEKVISLRRKERERRLANARLGYKLMRPIDKCAFGIGYSVIFNSIAVLLVTIITAIRDKLKEKYNSKDINSFMYDEMTELNYYEEE